MFCGVTLLVVLTAAATATRMLAALLLAAWSVIAKHVFYAA
jgi:hypothetical protein